MNMSPYELAIYLEQQRQKRHETMKELLELEDPDVNIKEGDYSIQV